MVPKSRPVLCHSRYLIVGVLLVLLVLSSSIVTAAAVSGAGLTVKPTLIVARTTVTPTPVPTVTCTAPCECLTPSQATAKWGSAFSRCQASPCGYIMSDLTADTTKYCLKPSSTTYTATLNCPSGQTACRNSYCANTSTDNNNCGSCGTVCPADKACSNGQCVLKIIPAAISNNCANGGTLCNGVCVNTQGSDSNNCGGCGWVCPSGLSCYQGECSMDCPSGYTDCQYDCFDLKTNADHCGNCGTSCPAGWNCCNGKCTDTKNDASSCGSCGHQCETNKNQVCTNGLCKCKPGMLICDSSAGCTDVMTNPKQCGSCNHACPAGMTCANGHCQPECTWCSGPVKPFLINGQPDQKIDIIFVPNQSYQGDYEKFKTDISTLISKAYRKSDPINNGLSKFNFYYYTEEAQVFEGFKFNPPPSGCAVFESSTTFADSIGVLHPNDFRDWASGGCSRRVFTSEPTSYRTIIHESGHSIFGLADEYCCDGGYWEDSTNPNIFTSKTNCQNYATNNGFNKDNCTNYCPAGTEKCGTGGFWKSDPEIDVMQCSQACGLCGGPEAMCQFGPACLKRVNAILNNYP